MAVVWCLTLRQEALKTLEYLDKNQYEKNKEDLLSTLRWAYVIPGDIVWVPFGHIMVEKSVGSVVGTTVRIASTLFHEAQLGAAMLYTSAYPQKLGLGLGLGLSRYITSSSGSGPLVTCNL